MAKDLTSTAGQRTLELPGVTQPGRLPIGERPMTNAERQARHRAKHVKLESGSRMAATIADLAAEFDLSKEKVIQHLLRFALCNRNWRQTGFPSTLPPTERRNS